MTDRHLRDLARRAEATGTIEDEAALLLAPSQSEVKAFDVLGGSLASAGLSPLASRCLKRKAEREIAESSSKFLGSRRTFLGPAMQSAEPSR